MSIQELGDIEYRVSMKARNLRVKIMADGLEVVIPRHLSRTHAMEFLNENIDKIIKKQKLVSQKLDLTKLNPFQELNTFPFKVQFVPFDKNLIHYKLHDEVLLIEYPTELDFDKPEIQQQLWKGITHFLRQEAKRILPEKTFYFSKKHGLPYNSVRINSAKTRWGSCSQKKNINLSLYLMLLPEHLIDYVVLHELCHTREMNHGVKFWKMMNELTGSKVSTYRAEMKKFHIPS